MDKFAFVVSNGPKVPQDKALRTMIRKQAMRDVAIERRRRGKGSKPLLSCEEDTTSSEETGSSESSSGSSSSSPTTDPSPITELVSWNGTSTSPDSYADWFFTDLQTSFSTIIPNPLSPYDALCAQHNLNLEHLSGLTCFGISTPIVAKLGDNDLLNSLLGHKQDTYLRYVPSRYGKVKCITAAVDCLLAKLAARLKQHDPSGEAKSLALYAKALQEIQICVADDKKSKESDTMCAIMLLCLYELLDPTKGPAFQQHVFGIAHLARHRKASSFTTDFDKMLLYGSLGSTVIESIIKWDHCYLAEPEWHEAYLGFTEETTWLTNRSPVTVRIHLLETHLAGLIMDTNIAVTSGAVFEPGASDDVRRRLETQHRELLECMDLYKAHLMQVSLLQPPQEELDMRRELFGNVLEHLVVIKRLLGAMVDKDRLRLEVEVHALALLLEEIHNSPGPRHAWLFSEHEHSVIECVRDTSHLWSEDMSGEDEERQRRARVHRWEAFIILLTSKAHPEPPPTYPMPPNPTSRYGWVMDLS